MISIKEATRNASIFAVDALGQERVKDLRLEEVESATADGIDTWLITLSMQKQIEPSDTFSEGMLAAFGPRRDYKIFAVRKDNGDVLSMKIRELANA